MKQSENYKGYLIIQLYKQGKRKTKAIHRLVANAFIDDPLNKPQVNHKDGNKQNNNISNLEWCTQSENNFHAYKMGLKKTTEKNRKASRKNIQIARTYNYKTSDTKKKGGYMEENSEKIKRMTPVQVATKLEMSPESIRAGLRQGKFPFGVAFQGKTGQWIYIILEKKFYSWAEVNNIEIKE